MSLQSKLFRGDSKLEAAAVSDPAHIMLGASGPHVYKIQTALMLLDGAAISADELQRTFYGASTANAVLAYKQKRAIINRSYQTQADNIVGKMTIASLDREMQKWEALPHGYVRIKPLFPRRAGPIYSHGSLALLALFERSRSVVGNVATSLVGDIEPPHILPGDDLVMMQSSRGKFAVLDGWPGEVKILDPDIAKISSEVGFPSDKCLVTDSLQSFFIFSGKEPGITRLRAETMWGAWSQIRVTVSKKFPSPPPFHELPPHGHRPCDRWSEIQADPQSSKDINIICSTNTPQEVMEKAKLAFALKNCQRAIEHLDWYLSKGHGNDFQEDDNIQSWLKTDANIRARLKSEIFPSGKKPKTEGHFMFKREEFDTTKTEDFALSFGQIDRVDFSVDLGDATLRVWFKDRYEFHPCYPGLYSKMADDFVRGDNCIHAAAVEMKRRGAADYWMVGEAETPLDLLSK